MEEAEAAGELAEEAEKPIGDRGIGKWLLLKRPNEPFVCFLSRPTGNSMKESQATRRSMVV